MTPLVCSAEPLEPDLDLLAFYRPDEGFVFEHRGGGIVAWGAAETISVPPGPGQVARSAGLVSKALSSIRVETEIAPVVVGSLPFETGSPATLVVPAHAIIRRSDGTVWHLSTESSNGALPPEPTPNGARRRRARLSLSAVPSPAAFMEAVGSARKRIAQNELGKVVLARMLVARSQEPFDRRALLQRLRESEPNAYLFASHGFVGASPELLVSRFGERVCAEAVAGTAARRRDRATDDQTAAALLRSAKDRSEHAFVVKAVCDGLQEKCTTLRVPEEPSVLSLQTVLHLKTELVGSLRQPAPTALALAADLHPTPAVCGTPREAAMSLIRELESIDRTQYAGIVGWTDANGDGEWAVALRCAEVQGRIALLFAGAGIVADSDPEAELAETDAKFEGMLNALDLS
jgi:isochorismate synthase